MASPIVVREVWAHNVVDEINAICHILPCYPFASMDTEFPGVIFPTPKSARSRPSDHYQFLKQNVDALNIIQVGLTFSDADGNLPDFGTGCRYIWQFNFRDFDPEQDDSNPDSVRLLQEQGIDFDRNRDEGIDSAVFAELMVYSGILVKIVTGESLPEDLDQFLEIVRVLFGERVYDVKRMMGSCDNLYGGLDRVARALEVERAVGKCHQAGSDSLLTWHAFKKMCDVYFTGEDGPEEHAGVVYGLN